MLAGSRTATGKPLLANDSHLEYSNPGIWFMVHLRAPGLDVAGVALPGLPGVILGQNHRIAGAPRTGASMYRELYIEEVCIRERGHTRLRGKIEQARDERECIPVKPLPSSRQWRPPRPCVFEGGRALALR